MENKKIKCVVWDLDNTIWDGILSEDMNVTLKTNVVKVIKELDERGILQSISSKNDFEPAMAKLKEFNLEEYFIYPQINWNAKSEGLKHIASSINIGIDTIAFVDDQEFERDEVKFNLKEVLVIDSIKVDEILNREEFIPNFVTEDSKNRRQLYLTDIKRKEVEDNYCGSKEEFLSSLNMIFTIKNAEEEDLKRIEELTLRTHQLNSTGVTYSYEELLKLMTSRTHELILCQLDDKYGTYGKIGLAVIEKKKEKWILKLILMSCRVASRGVGSVLLNHIVQTAKKANVRLIAELIPTDRNRIMYITYKFCGFKEMAKVNEKTIFEIDYSKASDIPNYIKVIEIQTMRRSG